MKRHLILNADDLGINTQRSHGIFQAYEQGILTSASVLVNFADSMDAARRANERGLPTGLHLNLTEGSPISKHSDIESLLTIDGYFLGRDSLRRALDEEQIDLVHVEREARAQIEWFLEHSGQPTHIDGHHAMHVHPLIARQIVGLIDQYGIAFTIIPSEPHIPFGYEIDKKRSEFIESVSKEAEAARTLYKGHGLQTNDHFRGLAFSGSASMRNMRHILGRLPEGITHFMMHPGSANPSAAPFESDPQRQTELSILLDPNTKKEMIEREITLCSYADLF